MSIFDEFWSHVDKTGGPDRLRWEPGEPCHGDGSPCWMWLKTISRGYGVVWTGYQRGQLLVHRVAWELENGPIPPDLVVLHWCDHPACVNPEHLYLGDRADHTLKWVARGHQAWRLHPEKVPRGSRNRHAKLTEEDVREIRRLHRIGMLQGELKRKFNASRTCISRICNGISWKHLKEPADV
jgi:HNH endonuclease